MFDWIHHILEPHCQECRDERYDSTTCKSCETLRQQLEIANYEKKQLLQTILDSAKPQEMNVAPQIEFKELRPKSIPWAVRKQMLEEEDREKAKLMRRQEEITKLESELGITEKEV